MASDQEEDVDTHQSQTHVDENLTMDTCTQFSVQSVSLIIKSFKEIWTYFAPR